MLAIKFFYIFHISFRGWIIAKNRAEIKFQVFLAENFLNYDFIESTIKIAVIWLSFSFVNQLIKSSD